MSTPRHLEIFSDLNCAWCYFDHGSIKRLSKEYDIEIIWRVFPLHPDIPADWSVLLDIAETAGLFREDALSVLEQRCFSHAVDDDWKKSHEREIMVAPTYIVNQTRLAGSQPFERLEKLLQRNGARRK